MCCTAHIFHHPTRLKTNKVLCFAWFLHSLWFPVDGLFVFCSCYVMIETKKPPPTYSLMHFTMQKFWWNSLSHKLLALTIIVPGSFNGKILSFHNLICNFLFKFRSHHPWTSGNSKAIAAWQRLSRSYNNCCCHDAGADAHSRKWRFLSGKFPISICSSH